ncbi:MAG: histidine phosphatase family protein [bacterium]|nr:histidine phosphatase family protein [bacterium]
MSWPQGLFETLERVPTGVPYALLLRHAERFEITQGAFGHEVPLKPAGLEAAHKLGALLPQAPVKAYHSPLFRCQQTAEAILSGAQSDLRPTRLDPLFLAYFKDLNAAEAILQARHVRHVVTALTHREPVDGMRSLDEGSQELLSWLLSPQEPGLHLFCSHDHILCLLNHYIRQLEGFDASFWPDYLEGMAFWREGDRAYAAFRGERLDLT